MVAPPRCDEEDDELADDRVRLGVAAGTRRVARASARDFVGFLVPSADRVVGLRGGSTTTTRCSITILGIVDTDGAVAAVPGAAGVPPGGGTAAATGAADGVLWAACSPIAAVSARTALAETPTVRTRAERAGWRRRRLRGAVDRAEPRSRDWALIELPWVRR